MGKFLCFGKKKKKSSPRADKVRKDANETADYIVTSGETIANAIENYEYAKEKSGEIYESGEKLANEAAQKAKEYEKEGKKAYKDGCKTYDSAKDQMYQSGQAVSDYASSTANAAYDSYAYYTTPTPEPAPTKTNTKPKKSK